MEYRNLGKSGLKVSPLCLGTMMFGGRTDAATSEQIINEARDAGFNFLDTADAYNGGRSEEVTGRAIKSDRDWWIVATKACNFMGNGPNQGGLSRKWLIEETENSLRRLDTDYIDILYLHKEDLSTPLEETLRALGDLIRTGKIRHFGISNFKAWRIAEIVRICDNIGIDHPIISQPYYNAMNRMPEVEQLPVCAHYGIGVFPYSPLARGVLTGKYVVGQEPEEGTRAATKDVRMMQSEWRDESIEISHVIKAYAEKKGITPIQFAVCWVLNNEMVTGTIAGPRTIDQWRDYVAALDYTFTEEDEALLDGLVPIGHPSTPGYNDPAYPIEGRVPANG